MFDPILFYIMLTEAMLPSGNLTKLWKITMFNGKRHYKWSCSKAMLNCRRVQERLDRRVRRNLCVAPQASMVERLAETMQKQVGTAQPKFEKFEKDQF